MTRCSKCCEDFNINPLHLVMPHLMGPDGIEFVAAHGVDIETLADLRKGAVLLDNGEVKIKHRCEMLTDDGLCSIYEHRPKICRDFDCRLKTECTGASPLLPDGAIALKPVTHSLTASPAPEIPEDDE